CGWTPSVRLRHRTAFVCAGSVRRTYTERTRNSGDACRFRPAAGKLWISVHNDEVSIAASEPVSHPHVSRVGERQLLHAAWHRRHSVPFPAPLPGWAGVHTNSIRHAADAAGDCGDEPEVDDAENSGAYWLSRRADFEYRDPWSAHHPIRDHWCRH